MLSKKHPLVLIALTLTAQTAIPAFAQIHESEWINPNGTSSASGSAGKFFKHAKRQTLDLGIPTPVAGQSDLINPSSPGVTQAAVAPVSPSASMVFTSDPNVLKGLPAAQVESAVLTGGVTQNQSDAATASPHNHFVTLVKPNTGAASVMNGMKKVAAASAINNCATNSGMNGGMNNMSGMNGVNGGMNNMSGMNGMNGGMNNMSGMNGVNGGMNNMSGMNGMSGGMNNMSGMNGMNGGMNNMSGMNGMGGGMNNMSGMNGMNNMCGMNGMNNMSGMNGGMNNMCGMNGMNNMSGMNGGMNGMGGMGSMLGMGGGSSPSTPFDGLGTAMAAASAMGLLGAPSGGSQGDLAAIEAANGGTTRGGGLRIPSAVSGVGSTVKNAGLRNFSYAADQITRRAVNNMFRR